jgi:hypothetical protein
MELLICQNLGIKFFFNSHELNISSPYCSACLTTFLCSTSLRTGKLIMHLFSSSRSLFLSIIPLLLSFIQLTLSTSCPAKNPFCELSSLVNDSSILQTFLGEHDTVVFQDGVLGGNKTCKAMTVLFARGTAEPGSFALLLRFDCSRFLSPDSGIIESWKKQEA